MTITHFNRDPRPGNYTFEQLFRGIREELARHIEVESYDLPAGIGPLAAIRWARERAGGLNHITGDVNYLAYGLPPGRTLITVHDLGHYSRTLKGWKKWAYRRFWLDGPLRRAARLTAISEFTKNELVRLLGIPEKKISVIPDPLLPGFAHDPKETMSEKPVILQIGSGSNKNLPRLIEAVAGLDIQLLLVNRLSDPALKARMDELKITYEQRSDLDFKGLLQAYRDCDILFFASEYEGFGMPILEAQATGRPVITSNIASMPEVAGEDGAILVDPSSIQEIRQAILTLVSDRDRCERLIPAGLDNVKKYAVEEIARKYLEVYAEF
ncbi:MAG: glycosyltransferase family 1 protein [Saprospiraceae bacterium]